MCGRYAMSLLPSAARRRLQQENMQVDDAPDDNDDSTRQTYNFAPGSHGLVYRAELPDSTAASEHSEKNTDKVATAEQSSPQDHSHTTRETKYKLQAMKWGLIPFWTKRAPDYTSQLKTINCRDDSLAQPGGMWNVMKQKKRCIIIAEGFYEWQKKNNGRDKIPHFVKRKDGQLMCFAGLWDCVKYEGHHDNLYTYTIITTSANNALSFLHHRMPVILDNGSDEIKTWLDPTRSSWSKELQDLLKPYSGELEYYPVDRAVGKVGNNSPTFIIPIDSKENKKNIANFFSKPDKDPDETRKTEAHLETTEDNAPLPRPKDEPIHDSARGIKREHSEPGALVDDSGPPPAKVTKSIVDDCQEERVEEEKPHLKSPERAPASGRRTRSAISNGSATKAVSKPIGDGSKKITAFFGR